MTDYPYFFESNCKYNDIVTVSSRYENHHINQEQIYKLMCRVMLKRTSGNNLYFMTVTVLGENLPTSEFQIVIHNKILLSDISVAKKITLGDVIGVEGYLGKTKVGEPSIYATNFILLAPCLHDIPKEQYISEDPEVKFRQRYLDMIINSKTRHNLITRSKVLKFLRNYLDDKEYLEVETPILSTNYGGANAKPFKLLKI